MTIDKNRLKALAEAVLEIQKTEDQPIGDAWDAFESAAKPATILALLGEIAELKDIRSLVKDEDLKWKGLREQEGEIKQLKAENEALCKGISALLDGDIGQEVLWRFDSGQGNQTPDGEAWLAARELAGKPKEQSHE